MSEGKSQFSLATSTAAYDNAPKTKEMIQAEAEYADYVATNTHPQRGIKGNIMFGHGKTQDVFEKRDFVTTNDLVYDKR